MQRSRHNPKPRAAPRPLDQDGLLRLALHYVGRYATTEAKLRDYLHRKVRERGWAGDDPADFEDIIRRCVDFGYVDDRSFAEAKAGALNRRGYGERRIGAALHVAGIDRDLAASVMPDEDAAFTAAQTYARRKRIGPFGEGAINPAIRQKHLAAMIRAGHPFELARKFALVSPDTIDASDTD
jgi:regulatory protein